MGSATAHFSDDCVKTTNFWLVNPGVAVSLGAFLAILASILGFHLRKKVEVMAHVDQLRDVVLRDVFVRQGAESELAVEVRAPHVDLVVAVGALENLRVRTPLRGEQFVSLRGRVLILSIVQVRCALLDHLKALARVLVQASSRVLIARHLHLLVEALEVLGRHLEGQGWLRPKASNFGGKPRP